MASVASQTIAQIRPRARPARPLPAGVTDNGHRYTLVQRVQCLTLLTEGFSYAQVEQKTGVKERTQRNIRKKARDRGFRPDEDPRILESYVVDGERSGRPKEISQETEEALLTAVRDSRAGREKSSEVLAYEQGISYSSAIRILHKGGLNSVKKTTKPGLTQAMRNARYKWALAHAHWTLEDWKKVIWSDETSVVLGHRRGQVRCWRATDEAFADTVIRRRWKGFSEFMFWGCFSYDRKGPCHIWRPQTVAQRKQDDEYVAEINVKNEAEAKAKWELTTGIHRLNLRRNPPGKKPQWKWTQANGKFVRRTNGGIDFVRYYREIMLAKLIPFAKECQQKRPDTLVQEDGAPAHAHAHQAPVYEFHKVPRLLWPGNSPDVNAIEPAWPWMKKVTTARGAPTARPVMEKAWIKAWNDLPQHKIQAWIERIPRHVQEIIRLKGGNEYPEGRKAFKRNHAGTRIKGKLSSHAYLHPQSKAEEKATKARATAQGWETDAETEIDLGSSDENDSD
jgi:transposase